jgi:conjugal transfer ATP-binding protein TraC
MAKKTKKEKEIKTPSINTLWHPDAVQYNYDYLRLGQWYVRVFCIEQLPRMAYVGWLDDINNIGGVTISTHINPIPDKIVSNHLLSAESKARSQWMLDQESGNIARMPVLEQQIDDYSALRNIIATGQDRLYDITIYIAIYAGSPEELKNKTDIMESILARKTMTARCLYSRHLQGFSGILPFADNPIEDYSRNMTSAATACCLPLTTVQSGHSTGIMLGPNIYSGSPVLLDRFAGEGIIPNQHMFISGVSGSGKSVSLRAISLWESYRGIKTAFVDPEGEYVDFTDNLGGQVVSMRPGRFSGINPFDLEPESEDGVNKVNIFSKVADVLSIIDSVFIYRNQSNMQAQEASVVESAIISMYKQLDITDSPSSLYLPNGDKKQMPTFTALVQQLKNMGSPAATMIAETIQPLTSNGSIGMFDGQTSLKLSNVPFLCFNLKGLADEFSKFVGIQAVLAWLWQKFAQPGGKNNPKNIAVDEAWMFLRYKGAAQYLETLARRGRKHGCALTIATQRFEEFAKEEEGRAVIESCATILVLKQEEHAVNAAVDYFHLSDGCIPIITPPAPSGQGILRVGGNTTAIQIQPAPFEWSLLETRISG